MSAIARQLALALAKEIIARKRRQHISPSHALRLEISEAIASALDSLVSDGSLTRHDTLNNIAYALPLPAQSDPSMFNQNEDKK